MPIITWNRENPKITKRGATEYLETNKGNKKLRTWYPARGEWLLTGLGVRYFRERPSEYIVSLPVRYDIIRERDNARIQYRGYMPVVNLSAGLRATMEEITARNGNAPDLVAQLRTGILNQIMQFRSADGTVAVHYESDCTTFYNPDTPRNWKYDELRTTVEPNASYEQEAF